MSTNIKVQRICQHCGKEFTAKTTVTQYCGDDCAKRAYKARKRSVKIESSNKETTQVITKPIEELKAQEFLSVRNVAKLIGSSRQTIYNLINSGKLKAVNILEKKTIVKRRDLDYFLEQDFVPRRDEDTRQIKIDISDCYSLSEIKNKYGISDKALHEIIKRNKISKIRKGSFAYVPKTEIEKILT
jgi:excisionase family DNA binding protein